MNEQEFVQHLYDDSKKMSNGLSKLGRQIVFAIIAGAWTLSYSHSEFSPSYFLLWSIALAFIYLFFDLLYYLIMYLIYRGFVVFNKDETKLVLTNSVKNTFIIQAKWDKIAGIWVIFETLLLLASAVLIIIHVFSV